MAKIALRAYHQSIDKMIDNGQLEEALAHCQHILKTFPKSLETYRVLGRVFLEQRRFEEAADIFQRVLLSVPDDFIGNLGMSMVREEQKNLDAAIYHMERAFDVQSANAAIQGELRRLYGKRDGMEPPKIRLTRGALANMYAKGAQFDQAIMEIRSVLGEEANRADMQVLLARVYHRGGKRVEATELCNTLIKKYPFTLDANRIMAEILTQAGRTDSAQAFRQNVNQLDPYAAFTTGSLFDSDKVADAAVTMEKLDWQPGEAPAWTAPAAALASAAAPPAWVTEPQALRPAVEEVAPAIPTSEDNIPDFLKQAGWGTSTGAFQEGPVNFDEPQETPAQAAALDELANADMPDWLKAIAPTVEEDATTPAAEAEADMDFLSNLGVPSSPAAPAPSQPAAESFDWVGGAAEAPAQPQTSESLDWLGNLGEPPAAAPAPAPTSDEVPDWMRGMEASQAPAAAAPPSDDIPVWMKGFGEPQAQPANVTPAQPAEDVPDWMRGAFESQPSEAKAEESSDWLAGLGATEAAATSSSDDMDWLKNLGEPETPAPQESKSTPPVAAPVDTRTKRITGWLRSLEEEQPTAQEVPAMPDKNKPQQPPKSEELSSIISGPGTSSNDQDDALAWLESLAAKQGAKSEELLTKPSDRSEAAPAWVNQVGAQPAKPAEPPAPYQPEKPIEVEAQPASPSSPMEVGLGTTAAEQDDALAWLESLAAKQGAKPEELLTKPEERREEKPAWVSSVTNKPTQTSPLVSAPGIQPADQDQSMAWLENLAAKQGAQPEELITKPEERKSEEPDWLDRLSEAEEPQQPAVPAAAPQSTGIAEDDAFAWLEALAAKQGAKSEELLTKPEERREERPEWVAHVPAKAEPAPAETESAWFTPEPEKTSAEEQPWFTPEPEKAEPEQPWFTPTPEPAPVASMPQSVAAEDDITAWLHQLDEEDNVTEAKPVATAGPVEEDKPEFLTALETHTAEANAKELPEWLRADLEEKTPAPVTPSEWKPEQPSVQTPPPPVVAAKAAETPPVATAPVPPPMPAKLAKTGPLRTSKRDMSYLAGTKENDVFMQARTEMNSNNLRGALDEYSKLIKRGRMLEEVIGDLRDATYSHPVDVVVWQTLGDAYMRAGRLQEALNSYTKAEELLR